jgi:hypothetical protein
MDVPKLGLNTVTPHSKLDLPVGSPLVVMVVAQRLISGGIGSSQWWQWSQKWT